MAFSTINNFTTGQAYLTVNFGASIQDGTTPFTEDKTLSGTGTFRFKGDTASNNSKTNVMAFRVPLGNSYPGGTDIPVVVYAATSPTANTSSTLTVEAYLVADSGLASAGNLIATAAQSINFTSFAGYTYTITGATLTTGCEILLVIKTVNNATGAASNSIAYVSKARLLPTNYGAMDS